MRICVIVFEVVYIVMHCVPRMIVLQCLYDVTHVSIVKLDRAGKARVPYVHMVCICHYKHIRISQLHQSSRTYPSAAHSTHTDAQRPYAQVEAKCVSPPPSPPTSPSQTTHSPFPPTQQNHHPYHRPLNVIFPFPIQQLQHSPSNTAQNLVLYLFANFYRIDIEQQPRSQILARCGILRLCAASVLGRAVMDVAARVRRSITQLVDSVALKSAGNIFPRSPVLLVYYFWPTSRLTC
jgi:hypothetical protein